MDIRAIKEIAIRLRFALCDAGLRPALILLYGSRANGNAGRDSDIDIAVVSAEFGKDRLRESIDLNRIGFEIDGRMELIPVGIDEYMDPEPLSPILAQIKRTGIPLI